MRDPVSSDDLEELEGLARTPEAHRAAATALTSWADDPHPDDEDVTPAELICAAAWHLGRAGDIDDSLDLYRRAVAIGGTAVIDARALLVGALFDAGRDTEARQVADDFRRANPRLVDLATMAENFEIAGDLTQAYRWVNIGVNRLQLDDPDEATDDDHGVAELLRARRRIRAALGHPPDDLDEAADLD